MPMSGDVFLIVTLGGGRGVTGIYWVEAREAAKHPTMHRTAPNKKELSGPKC